MQTESQATIGELLLVDARRGEQVELTQAEVPLGGQLGALEAVTVVRIEVAMEVAGAPGRIFIHQIEVALVACGMSGEAEYIAFRGLEAVGSQGIPLAQVTEAYPQEPRPSAGLCQGNNCGRHHLSGYGVGRVELFVVIHSGVVRYRRYNLANDVHLLGIENLGGIFTLHYYRTGQGGVVGLRSVLGIGCKACGTKE